MPTHVLEYVPALHEPALRVGAAGALVFVLVAALLQRLVRGRAPAAVARPAPPSQPVRVCPLPAFPADRTCELSGYWGPVTDEAEHGGGRRRAPRRDGRFTAVLLADPDGRPPQKGYVLNRSSVGLLLTARHPVPAGATLRLRARDAPPGTPWAAAVVRWCEEGDGRFEVGCEFAEDLPWGVLLLFG
jgi:hypothetical protein